MSQYDVIVIGSGIGGLSAALTAARVGKSVLVLEAERQFGGFINPFARKKFCFDTGIHYVGEMGKGRSLHQQFEKLGLLDDLKFRELNPNGFDRYVFPDYEIRLGNSLDDFHNQLAKDFPSERTALRKFFKRFKEIDRSLRDLQKRNSFWSALGLLPKIPQLLRYKGYTYKRLLDQFFVDPRLKAALSGPGGDIGLPPSRASALVMIGLISHFSRGAYYPIGGSKKVRDTYVEHLKKNGATLKRNSPVATIAIDQGKASGVQTVSGERYKAAVVISNASALHTLRDMVGYSNLKKRPVSKIKSNQYSIGSVCVFVGTSQQPNEYGLDDANLWHYPSYDIDSLYQPVLEGRLMEEMPFFLTVPTLKDPHANHAPPGKHTVELITFAPWKAFQRWSGQPVLKRDVDYMQLKNEVGRRLLSAAEKYIPGLEANAEVIEISSPLTNSSFANTPDGCIYGLDHTPNQIGSGRWGTQSPIPGLLFCGADSMGGGIAPCVTSGTAAGNLALKLLDKRN
ncbi:MAG: NAD(P)/FAD-dependent oxidoreductase [Mariniblastus sp.]|nr:NAD(P)/FAD-dependent oxidoreductase [Mariniblastus sp.]